MEQQSALSADDYCCSDYECYSDLYSDEPNTVYADTACAPGDNSLGRRYLCGSFTPLRSGRAFVCRQT